MVMTTKNTMNKAESTKAPVKKTVAPAGQTSPKKSEAASAKVAAPSKANTLSKTKSAQMRVRVAVPLLNVRKSGSLSASIISVLKEGECVTLASSKDGFGKLADGSGYVHLDFVERI